jgi:hypothetical protein
MEKSLTEQYLELYLQKVDIENKMKPIHEAIIQKVQQENIEKFEGTIGFITKAERVSYSYSPDVLAAQENLKAKMNNEIDDGTASKKITQYVRVSLKKLDNININQI